MASYPNSPEEIFEDFSNDYRGVFGDDVSAIYLYGSGARGDYVAGRSDINFLIILTQKGIDSLDKALDLIARWRKRNVAVPLMLTKRYIDSALDTFPIEFLGMKQHHKLVFGEDLLSKLEIDESDLRLQIERELRGKLLHLRGGFLATGHEREQLRDLLTGSVPTFVSIFEALLFLKSSRVSADRKVVFEKTAELFKLDFAVLQQVLNVRSGQWRGSTVQLQEIALAYIRQIKRLVENVDTL